MIHHGLLRQVMGFIFGLFLVSACGTKAVPQPTEMPPAPLPTLIPTSTPQSTLIPTPTPSASEWQSTIMTAMNTLNNLTYRYQSNTVLENDETHSTVFEYVPPDRYHIISDSVSELVVIGQKVYVKQNDIWTESDMLASAIIDPDANRKLDESIHNIHFIGNEVLNGKPMQVYQYLSKTTIGDEESTTETEIWIGSADLLPYKMIIQGETAAVDADSGKIVGSQALSTITFEYDPDIQIDPIN